MPQIVLTLPEAELAEGRLAQRVSQQLQSDQSLPAPPKVHVLGHQAIRLTDSDQVVARVLYDDKPDVEPAPLDLSKAVLFKGFSAKATKL